jgi:hypothetical protein
VVVSVSVLLTKIRSKNGLICAMKNTPKSNAKNQLPTVVSLRKKNKKAI